MNLAVFLPNWIGDVVMATPALRALRAHFQGASIIGVCRPYVASLLDGAPWVDEQVYLGRGGPWSHRWPAVAWQLRKHPIDLAVLFPNSFRIALVAWLARSSRIIGYNRYGRGFMLSDRLEADRNEQGHFKPTPIIDDYNRLAEAAGCPPPGHRMELFTTNSDENAADQIWQRLQLALYREVICLNPGAAFGAAKHWDTAYFVDLARQLADKRGAGVLVLCGPNERAMARQIANGASRPSVHSLADAALSLGLTKALIRRSSLLITTDSGPRHFAAAFDRPVVTLFGPTHIAWTETYFPRAVHLQKAVPCGPCQERVCPTGDHRCMKELLSADVYRAAVELLDRQSPQAPERKAS
jgi:lipopolysaccharide heptosyltransferase II